MPCGRNGRLPFQAYWPQGIVRDGPTVFWFRRRCAPERQPKPCSPADYVKQAHIQCLLSLNLDLVLCSFAATCLGAEPSNGLTVSHSHIIMFVVSVIVA